MKKIKKDLKTNAMRLLDLYNVEYKIHYYDAPEGFLDGVSVAMATGEDPIHVYKTLVIEGGSKENYVAVIQVAKELDLKKYAKVVGEKKVELIHVKDLTEKTGYIKGGCSPIGMKKLFKTIIDKSALELDYMIISGGKVGTQVELKPSNLCELIEATFEDIII